MNDLRSRTYRVRARRIVRARILDVWEWHYRWYWQANLRSLFEHYVWGYECCIYERNKK